MLSLELLVDLLVVLGVVDDVAALAIIGFSVVVVAVLVVI